MERIEFVIKTTEGALVTFEMGGIKRAYFVTEEAQKDREQYAPASVHAFGDIVRERMNNLPDSIMKAAALFSKKVEA